MLPFGEILPPILGKSRRIDGLLEEVTIVLVAYEEPVHVGDCDCFMVAADHVKGVAGGYQPFPFDGEIEPAAAAVQESLEDVISLELCRQLVAWNPRLPDHDDRRTDLKSIADVKFILDQSLGREILTKHSPLKLGLRQFLSPKRVVLRRIGVREQEKARIARELHDELGQALTGLKMDLEEIVAQLEPRQTDALDRAQAMRSLLDSTVSSVRRIATELRPLMLDDLGLIATIEWLVGDFAGRTGVEIELELPGSELAVEPDLSTALFRVLQESLTNVARHAGASRAEVRLSRSDSDIRLQVQDNGHGIDPDRAGKGRTFGLLGMRERATMVGGELVIDSTPGAGTSIVMIVPCRPAGLDTSGSELPRSSQRGALFFDPLPSHAL